MRSPGALRLALLAGSLLAWWAGNHALMPWAQQVAGLERVTGPVARTLLGHWVFWQLPTALACLAVWWAGARLGLLPPPLATLRGGGSWRRVVAFGLAGGVAIVAWSAVGAAFGGGFGFHPDFPKMAGDLVSNLYEEIVYRGLIFCTCYGVAAGATPPLEGPLDRMGLVAAAVGSAAVFGAGHDQAPVGLRLAIGVAGIIFAWPFWRTRSLWAPWLAHMVGDVVGDTFLTL
jgi:membrane protease YdiL (CAAX protease family)